MLQAFIQQCFTINMTIQRFPSLYAFRAVKIRYTIIFCSLNNATIKFFSPISPGPNPGCVVGWKGTRISHERAYVSVRTVVKETRTISRAKAMHRRGFRSNGNAGNKKNAYLGLKASTAAYCSSRIGGGATVSTATRRNIPSPSTAQTWFIATLRCFNVAFIQINDFEYFIRLKPLAVISLLNGSAYFASCPSHCGDKDVLGCLIRIVGRNAFLKTQTHYFLFIRSTDC